MSWGTSYTHSGFLSHIGKGDLSSKEEECEETIHRIRESLLSYMAMTPPAYARSSDGTEYPWNEFLQAYLSEIMEELEDAYILRTHLWECQEALRDHPEGVTEG